MEHSFVLASRSPRRRELLGLIVPADRISIVPPRDAAEAGFDGLSTTAAIERRLAEIARAKAEDVADQLGGATGAQARVIIAADTTVVVGATDGALCVLGQPPETEAWRDTVRRWFREHYAGRTHRALTALCVIGPTGRRVERIASTAVTIVADVEKYLAWYLATEEPRGKAGGYAIQGAASVFVSQVTGSLSNVIGLPLEALLDAFEELQVVFE